MRIYPIHVDLPGRLSLATCPRADNLKADVDALAEESVTVVVSAIPESDEDQLGLWEEPSALATVDIDFLRIPIVDFGVPEDVAHVVAKLRTLLQRLADSDEHIVIHCLGGLGRSPLLAASLLVLEGDDPEVAWAIVGTARRRPVPETAEQRAWVDRLVLNDPPSS